MGPASSFSISGPRAPATPLPATTDPAKPDRPPREADVRTLPITATAAGRRTAFFAGLVLGVAIGLGFSLLLRMI
jgi:hypothetical protein